jgi:hypothetical protein
VYNAIFGVASAIEKCLHLVSYPTYTRTYGRYIVVPPVPTHVHSPALLSSHFLSTACAVPFGARFTSFTYKASYKHAGQPGPSSQVKVYRAFPFTAVLRLFPLRLFPLRLLLLPRLPNPHHHHHHHHHHPLPPPPSLPLLPRIPLLPLQPRPPLPR